MPSDYFTDDEYRAVTRDTNSPLIAEAEDVVRAQEEVIDRLESWARTAWKPRTIKQTVRSDVPEILLSRTPVRSVSSLKLDGTAVPTYELSAAGVIRWGVGYPYLDRDERVFPFSGYFPVEIVYTYGFTSPKWTVKRPCILACESLVRSEKSGTSKLPPNTTRYSVANTDLELEGQETQDVEPWPWDPAASSLIRTYWEPKRLLRVMTLIPSR